MGAESGPLTYVRFHAFGYDPERRMVPAEDGKSEIAAVRHRRFRRLGVTDDQTCGWVTTGNPLDTEGVAWGLGTERYDRLTMRLDKWAIPGAVLKAHMKLATAKRLIETGQKRLSKSQREELKEMVTARLREESIPAMKICDVVWDRTTDKIRFWGSGKSIEAFLDLFRATFGIELMQDGAFWMANGGRPATDAAMEAAMQLEPIMLHFTPIGVHS